MRVLTYVLCGLCLSGGAMTVLAMTRVSLADENPVASEPAQSAEPARSRDTFLSPGENDRQTLFGRAPAVVDSNRLSHFSDLDIPVPAGNESSGGLMRARQVRRTFVETYMEPVPAEELAAAKKLQEAIKSLKNSSEPEAQKKATDTIQQQLSEQFDLDLKQREKELAEVEAKVKSLREQLDKRKAAREDIISLRLKTITNDAAGLGFPGGGGTTDALEHVESSLQPVDSQLRSGVRLLSVPTLPDEPSATPLYQTE